MILSVDADGKMSAGAGPFAGLWFKDADREILRDLRQRGLLLKDERYKHNYPFCWRCDQPLLYFANRSWFVRTTELRDRLVGATTGPSTGIRRTSVKAASATGSRTSSTGRYRASATGARRCRCGAATPTLRTSR